MTVNYASSMTESEQKELRKQLGLPVTRSLKYTDPEGTEHAVSDFCIYETYPSYMTVEIILDDGSRRLVHCDYLSEMNRASSSKKSSPKKKEKAFNPEKYTGDFVVFDIETTGKYVSEDCVTEISAVKISGGKQTESFHSLVNPGRHIHRDAAQLTGISDSDLENAPGFKTVISDFMDFCGDMLLVGHNIHGFDLPIMERQIAENGLDISIDNSCLDTLVLAKRALKSSDIEDRKLSTLADRFGIDAGGAHRALRDCEITKDVYLNLVSLAVESDFQAAMKRKKQAVKPVRKAAPVKMSADTENLNTLRQMAGRIADGTESSTADLKEWIASHPELEGSFPYDDIRTLIESSPSVYETAAELKKILSPDSVFETSIDSLEGKQIVLTGDFRYGSKEEVEALVSSLGGVIKSGVSKKTDCVIVGGLGSERWAQGNYGSKIKKAMELKRSGIDVHILTEDALSGLI